MIEVKRFFKYFRVPLIMVCVIAVCFGIVRYYKGTYEDKFKESTNFERVYGDKRVFDYGDQLTNDEEQKLEAYIHEAEIKAQTDIVIVTLNESLKDFAPEYRANYDMEITPNRYVMVYADKFWEDNKFGYNCPQVMDGKTTTGDGVLLVDNLFREPETGRIYTWMCTTGNAEEEYSSDEINYALDVFYEYVEVDYYRACIEFVDKVVRDMQDRKLSKAAWPYVVTGIFLFIFIIAKIDSPDGENTIKEDSYLIEGSLSFPVCEDKFMHKNLTKTYNPPSSSSSSGGGGGHHSSGGGGSHGGGGHSR